jgi:seryl-tRNA synthetase
MLDPKFILENPELVKEAAKKKFIDFDVAAFIKLDKQRRAAQVKLDETREKKNKASKKIANLKGKEKDAAIKKMKDSKDEKSLAEKLRKIEEKWRALLLTAPGQIHKDVPVGEDDTANKELYKIGDLPKFDFTPKDHVELGTNLDILDIERGVKVSGARNYFLKGDGALLEMALMQFVSQKLAAKGFTMFIPPVLVNYRAMEGTSYFPGGEEQTYEIEKDEKFLIGTSEVSVASYHTDEILNEDDLPLLYAGHSTCFRREAGTYGKDTHGLYRVHQFQKVEQVIICKNDMKEAEKMHELLLKNAEEIMQDLGLPYRVVINSSGDMGQGQYFKNDIETWMPSRKDYGETHSCSNFLDFQARRLNLRYKDADGKKHFAYTLNNTAIATPRILIPLLEVHQNEDGTINIPEPLRPFMGGKEKIS